MHCLPTLSTVISFETFGICEIGKVSKDLFVFLLDATHMDKMERMKTIKTPMQMPMMTQSLRPKTGVFCVNSACNELSDDILDLELADHEISGYSEITCSLMPLWK